MKIVNSGTYYNVDLVQNHATYIFTMHIRLQTKELDTSDTF